MNFLVNLNLNKNELQNAVIQPLAVAPANPVQGQIYFDTVSKLLVQWDGTQWVSAGGGGAVDSVNGKTGVVVLTQDDVGDGSTYVRTHNDLTDALAALISGALQKSGGTMSGAIAMGSYGITGLAAPTNDADAATKKYADDLIAGLGAYLDFKGTVATTAALPLTGNKKGDVYIVTADNSEYVWTSASASGSLSDYEKLGTTVDLSGYLQLSGGTMTGAIAMGSNKITGLANGSASGDAVNYGQLTGLVKTATGTIATNATSASVSYSGTLVNAYATMGGSVVQVDMAVTSSAVTFSTAAAPASAVTCTVVYA